MRPLHISAISLCLLLLTSAIMTAQDEATIVDSTRKSGVICQLQRYSGDRTGYVVQIENRSGHGARIDYRVLSRSVSTWTGSIILRSADAQGRSDAMTLPLPAAADYFGADLVAVTLGTVCEKVVQRLQGDGTILNSTVLELVPDGTPSALQGQGEAGQLAEETRRLRQEVSDLRREQEALAANQQASSPAPVIIQVPEPCILVREGNRECPAVRTRPPETQPHRTLTWEELRTRELANERKVWKNF